MENVSSYRKDNNNLKNKRIAEQQYKDILKENIENIGKSRHFTFVFFNLNFWFIFFLVFFSSFYSIFDILFYLNNWNHWTFYSIRRAVFYNQSQKKYLYWNFIYFWPVFYFLWTKWTEKQWNSLKQEWTNPVGIKREFSSKQKFYAIKF